MGSERLVPELDRTKQVCFELLGGFSEEEKGLHYGYMLATAKPSWTDTIYKCHHMTDSWGTEQGFHL